ncbi:unnamed protein product [Aphanomyces euteiches]
MLRSVWSQPSLSADWSGDYDEKSAEWFELFLDLLMVTACSSVAETLKEDLTLHGWIYFVFLTSAYTVSWTLYTGFHARFNEKSLLHYLFLYVWLVGLGGMVLAGEPGVTFTIGLILIRAAQLMMYSAVYFLLRRARPQAFIDIVFLSVNLGILCISLLLPSSWTIPCYVVVLLLEAFGRLIVAERQWFLKPGHSLPANIDHMNERYGCLVMVVLGESIVSIIINFHDPALLTLRVFFMMHLALLVIFSMALFYFTIQPPREFHAMRRSRYTGIAFGWMHLPLFPSLLAIGVSLKLVTAAVLADKPLLASHTWWLFSSIAASMAIMVIIRLLHFGGRHPSSFDPIHIKRIKYVWWAVICASPLFPLICAASLVSASGDSIDPIHALVVATAFNVAWILAESAMMHQLLKLGYGQLSGEEPTESSQPKETSRLLASQSQE